MMELSKKHLLTTEPEVVIEVKQLSVWTPEEKPWWRHKATKPRTMILNNGIAFEENCGIAALEYKIHFLVTGCMKTGEFTAVIGPSGAGKTTFLVSLAGKCKLPSIGSVTLNSTDVKDLHRGVVEIVPQFETFIGNLTVMEHLIFMTEMHLGSITIPANKTRLETLIQELKLKSHVDSNICSLSGGERRLLSLASSLLSSPQVLICDEPTTGLDSFNASLVVGVLKKIFNSGTVVICSVHQPSSDVFNDFNTVTIMAEGEIVFHGPQDDCKAMFESVNLYCPKNYNIAEFYIKAVSVSLKEGAHLKHIKEHNRLHHSNYVNHIPVMPHYKICQRNWYKQVQLLLWRSTRTFKSDLRSYLIQLVYCTLISSLVMGTVFIGITGTNQEGVQNLRGLLWLICSEISFGTSYSSLFVFENKLVLFKREVGIYSSSAFFANVFICNIPRCIIWPVIVVVVVTTAVPLPNHLLTSFQFILVMIVDSIASSAYGLGMATMFSCTGALGDIMPCVDLPLFLMSGAFYRISSLPLWVYPIKYISHFYYAMDALSNIYWRQIDFIECPSNSTSNCYKDGISVLIETGYATNFVLQDSLGLLFVTMAWSFIGYLGLKREERKGYAY